MKRFESLTVGINGDLAKKLQDIAETEETELNNIVFNLLSNYVREYYTPTWKTKTMS